MPTTTRDAISRIRKPTSRSRDSRRSRPVEPSSAVAGVRISHPDRLIYPDLGISKIQLAQYYERIGEWIVPHVAARPLTLVHCPAGIAAPCHYLKHAKARRSECAAESADPRQKDQGRASGALD